MASRRPRRMPRTAILPVAAAAGVAACLVALFAMPAPAMAQRVTVSGTLRGPNGPIAGVKVFVGSVPARTDAQGRYSATFTPSGALEVQPEAYAMGRMGL